MQTRRIRIQLYRTDPTCKQALMPFRTIQLTRDSGGLKVKCSSWVNRHKKWRRVRVRAQCAIMWDRGIINTVHSVHNEATTREKSIYDRLERISTVARATSFINGANWIGRFRMIDGRA